MREKIKKILKPFLVVIIAGFIVSLLYISSANREIKKETRDLIKLPEISGNNYSDLESRINDLESRVSDLEDLQWRVDDLESQISDLESNLESLESSISNFRSCLQTWFSGFGVVKETDLWYCAEQLP